MSLLSDQFTQLSVHSSIYLSTYQYIHPLIHLSIYPFIYSSIHTLVICPCTDQSIQCSIYSAICPFIHVSAHLSIHPSIHLSIYRSIHPSIYPSVYPFIHPYTNLSMYLSIYSVFNLLTYLSIHPSICPFINIPIHSTRWVLLATTQGERLRNLKTLRILVIPFRKELQQHFDAILNEKTLQQIETRIDKYKKERDIAKENLKQLKISYEERLQHLQTQHDAAIICHMHYLTHWLIQNINHLAIFHGIQTFFTSNDSQDFNYSRQYWSVTLIWWPHFATHQSHDFNTQFIVR